MTFPHRALMKTRLPLLALTAGAVMIAMAYASAFVPDGVPGFAPRLLVGGMSLLLVGLLSLGAQTRRGVGPIAGMFVLLGLWVAGGFLVVMLMPAADPENPLIVLGLPLRAAILVYGVGVAPALIVPWSYAHVFDKLTLLDGDLDELRSVAARVADQKAAATAATDTPGMEQSAAAGGGSEADEAPDAKPFSETDR